MPPPDHLDEPPAAPPFDLADGPFPYDEEDEDDDEEDDEDAEDQDEEEEETWQVGRGTTAPKPDGARVPAGRAAGGTNRQPCS